MSETVTFEQGLSAPMWAKESTMRELVDALKDQKSTSNKDQKTQEKTLKEVDEALTQFINNLQNLNDVGSETLRIEKDNNKLQDDINDNMETLGFSFKRLGERAGFVGNMIGKVFGVALVAAGTAFAAVTAKLIQTGQTFAELSQKGLALEGATAGNIAAMNLMGLSTAQTAKFMDDNAEVFRVMGEKVVPGVTQQFLELTDQGGSLGLSLEDTISLIGDELTMRSGLINLGRLDAGQRKTAISQIAETNKKQLNYTRALGVSTDVMRDFADQVIGNNKMLLANILRLPNDARAQLVTGLSEFNSLMRAMGGEAGGEIAAAITEAASMGAIGFSDAAFGFITVLPQLADNFQGVIKDFEAGLIDGEQAALAITAELGNLSQAEKDRVFLLARTGDEQAKQMATAIQNFEKSADAMKTLTNGQADIEGVQRGFQAFNTILDKVKGAFSGAFNTFIQGFGEGLDTEGFDEIVKELVNAMTPVVQSLFSLRIGAQSFGGTIKESGQSFSKYLVEKIKDFALEMELFIKFFQGYMSTFNSLTDMFKDIGKRMLEGITDLIPWPSIGDALLVVISATVVAGIAKGIAAGFAQKKTMSLMSKLTSGGSSGGAMGPPAPGGMRGMGMGLTSMAGGLSALGSGPALLGIAALTAAIIGIGFALKLAAPGIEAFGTAIKSVFEGIGAVVESVGKAIANIIEKVGQNKVAKINAKAEAMVKTTEATTAAIKELSHLDPANVLDMALGIDQLGQALGTFSENMTPGIIGSLKQGFASLIGQESPVQAVIQLSKESDPQKIMNLAKATMATNAANQGATSLDSSLTPGSDTTNNTTTNNTYADSDTSKSDQALADLILEQSAIQLNALAEMRKQNKLLTEISSKT
jgi:hypothetical protein